MTTTATGTLTGTISGGRCLLWWLRYAIQDNFDGTLAVERPNIYVELDYMQGNRPYNGFVQDVADVFAEGSNRSGIPAAKRDIKVEVLLDSIPSVDFVSWLTSQDCTADSRCENFYDLKDTHFSAGSKKGVFHYALYVNRFWDDNADSGDGMALGLAEIGGNDLAVAYRGGCYADTHPDPNKPQGIPRPDEELGTFVHELGHNLTLTHAHNDRMVTGSCDLESNSIVHESVMNYRYASGYPEGCHTDPNQDCTISFSHGANSSVSCDLTPKSWCDSSENQLGCTDECDSDYDEWGDKLDVDPLDDPGLDDYFYRETPIMDGGYADRGPGNERITPRMIPSRVALLDVSHNQHGRPMAGPTRSEEPMFQRPNSLGLSTENQRRKVAFWVNKLERNGLKLGQDFFISDDGTRVWMR